MELEVGLELQTAAMDVWTEEQTARWVANVLGLSTDLAVAAQQREVFEDEEIDGAQMQVIRERRLGRVLGRLDVPMQGHGVGKLEDPAASARLVLHARAELLARDCIPVQEAPTPTSVRWSALLATEGPERLQILQAAVDSWQAGRWVLQERLLGHGSSGAVFESVDSHHVPKRVAIKFIHTDEDGREKITREAALMQRVDHPHVCKLHERHVSSDGLMCGMVLELLNR